MPSCMLTHTDSALSFREYFGGRIASRLALRSGMRVLEVCHGSDVVRIPPLPRIERFVVDLSTLPDDEAGFDAVVCGFGIHHARDMAATSRRLWHLVRPGGQLLIATWSEHLFEPANAAFWETVRHVRPSFWPPFTPWDAIDTPDGLVDMLAAAGIPAGQVGEEPYSQPVLEPEDWWEIVMNSHYRAIVDQLAPLERDAVELLTLRHVTEREIEWINAGALFALARK
jgi:SAM-dependent methyltransferase